MSTNRDNLMRYVRGFERVRRRRRLIAAMGYAIGVGCFLLILHSVVARQYPLRPSGQFVALIGIILPVFALWKYFNRVDFVASTAEIEKRESRFGQKLQTVVSQLLTASRLRASDELIDRLAQDLQEQLKDRPAESLVSVQPMIRAFAFGLAGSFLLMLVARHATTRFVGSGPLTIVAKPQAPVVAATAPATAPALVEMRVGVTYPTYLSKAPTVVSGENIEAPIGSELTVSLVANGAIADATLEMGGAVVATTQQSPDVRLGKITVTKDAIYQVKVSGSKDATKQLKIRAIIDHPPVLIIAHPSGDATATAQETREIEFSVGDDFGVAGIDADVAISSAANGRVRCLRLPVNVASPFKLSMPAIRVRAGDLVTLTLQTRDAGGQMSPAQTRRIFVTSKSRSLVATLPITELREASQASQALGKALELVAPQLEPNATRTALGRALAGADDASAAMQSAVTRIANVSSTDVALSLSDSAQELNDNVRQLRERLGSGGAAAVEKPTLAELILRSQKLSQQLSTLTRAVAASMLQAQLKPQELAAMAISRRDVRSAVAAIHSAAARAPALAPLAQELGLDPAAADLPAQAAVIVSQGQQLAQSFQPPNAFALAQQWIGALILNSQEARATEHRLAALARVNVADLHLAGPARAETSSSIAATQPLNLDQSPPNYREAIAAYFQALARDAAPAPTK